MSYTTPDHTRTIAASGAEAREAIVDTLLEDRENRRFGPLRFVEKSIDEYLSERAGGSQLDLVEQT